ncbi:hypothetical protein J6Z19_07765 [bacterium]|nr:hypothetical protein [bacterium]
MRNFLLLLTLFVFASCSNGIKKVMPDSDETPESGEIVEEADDSENREKTDDSTVPAGENSDGEEQPSNDGEPEFHDDAEQPESYLPEIPDEYKDNDPEADDAEYPVCGHAFDGSNCSAAYCDTIDDCCEGDVCVTADACDGRKVCRNAFFKENFDSYVTGNFPNEKWTLKYNGLGDSYQIVTSEKSVSPENSMHLLGKAGYGTYSGWAAIMTSVLPQVPDVINVEMQMNTEGDDVYFALCTFEREASGSNWGNYDVKVTFAGGKISCQIPEWFSYDIAPSYEPNEWYKIRLKLDQTNKIVSVWVNDELKVDNQSVSFDSLSIPNICLSSNKGQKKVWFDDIFVWAE